MCRNRAYLNKIQFKKGDKIMSNLRVYYHILGTETYYQIVSIYNYY